MTKHDNDERVTLDNGDDDESPPSTTKDLIQAVRWSARALGKIEGFFERLTKSTEMSQQQMMQEAADLREEMEQLKEEFGKVLQHLQRLETTVREAKATNELLVQECNRKWEAPHLPEPVQPESPANQIKNPILRVVAGWNPVYIALVLLVIAIVLMIISQSESLQELLSRLF